MLKTTVKKTIKKIKRSALFSLIVRYTIYGVIRGLFATYRLSVSYHHGLKDIANPSNGVYYFWHQSILSGMFFFFAAKKKGYCIVSPSSDGKIAGFICQKLGFDIIYGSSHKSPIALTKKALFVLKKHGKICIVGDGSRGPAFQLQKGIISLAKRANVPLVFVDCKPVHAFTFTKSWDQFQIPWPFSRIHVTIGLSEQHGQQQ